MSGNPGHPLAILCETEHGNLFYVFDPENGNERQRGKLIVREDKQGTARRDGKRSTVGIAAVISTGRNRRKTWGWSTSFGCWRAI